MPLLAQNEYEVQTLSDTPRILKSKVPVMRGQDVQRLQKKLVYLGYSLPQFGIDGAYGSETKSAVERFQEDHNVPVTGIVGPSTWKKLSEASKKNTSKLTTTASANSIGSFFKNMDVAFREAKNEFWDPLSTTEKLLYGGGTATLVLGAGIAIYNMQD